MRGHLHRRGALLAATALMPLTLGEAAAQSSENQVSLDEITVVPSRVEETATEAPAGVSVVGKSDMEILQPVQPADFFFGLPGVVASQSGSRTDSVVNIRGLQDFGRVVVTVDGARNNFYQNNHGNKTTFWAVPDFMRQVTVVRGPVSNTYGSGAIGGVVSFDTLNPDDILRPDEHIAALFRLTLQSNGEGVSGSTAVAARLGDAADVIGAFAGKTFDDYETGAGTTAINSANDGLAGLLKGRFWLNDFSELTLSWIGDEEDWRDGGATPTATGYDTDLRQDTFTGKFTYNDPDNPWLDFRGTAYSTAVVKDQYKYQGTSGVGTSRSFDLATTGFDVLNTSRFETGHLFHTLTYGGDWFHDDFFSSEGLFTPSGDRWAWGSYIQDRIAVTRWLEITGALRFDAYELDGGGYNVTDDQLSPRITAEVSPFSPGDHLDGLSFFATYAHGYRAPSIGETLMDADHPAGPGMSFPLLPNPTLRPETSTGYELGVNYARDGLLRPDDQFRSKLVWFDNDLEDYIGIEEVAHGAAIPTGTCVSPSIFVCYLYSNIDEVEMSGLEFDAEYDAGRWFGGLAISLINADYGSSGAAIANVPRDRYTGRLGFRLLDRKVTLGGELQYVASPKQVFTSSADPATYDAYTLVNLFAAWEPNPDTRFDLRVENLFDTAYGSVINAADGAAAYEPGLTVKVGASVRFGVKERSAAQ